MKIERKKALPKTDEFTFTAIDFERANSDMASVCSIGVCTVERGSVKKNYEIIIKPPEFAGEFTQQTTEIHGLTYNDVKHAPEFRLVWQKIKDDLIGLPIAAHSFTDDAKSLEALINAYKIDYNFYSTGHICTLELARRAGIHGDDNKCRLGALCEHYGIPLNAHHAGEDARGCALILLAMARELNISSLRELADFSQSYELPLPQLGEYVELSNLNVLIHFIRKMDKKDDVVMTNCPKVRDLNRLKKYMLCGTVGCIDTHTATDGKLLKAWLDNMAAKKNSRSVKLGEACRITRSPGMLNDDAALAELFGFRDIYKMAAKEQKKRRRR